MSGTCAELIAMPYRQPVMDWLLSVGFKVHDGMPGACWSMRCGYDTTSLEFYPLARWRLDEGWDAIVSHHASGTNPRMVIGRCETLADVQLVSEIIRRINGFKQAEGQPLIAIEVAPQ